jgi:hypothetical protein
LARILPDSLLQRAKILPLLLRGPLPNQIISQYTQLDGTVITRVKHWAHKQNVQIPTYPPDHHLIIKEQLANAMEQPVFIEVGQTLLEEQVISTDTGIWQLLHRDYPFYGDLPKGFPKKLVLEGYMRYLTAGEEDKIQEFLAVLRSRSVFDQIEDHLSILDIIAKKGSL